MVVQRKRRSFPRKKRSFKPSSQFKKALRKLNKIHNNRRKCELIQNSSDDFIRDLAFTIHKCLPIYKPLLNPRSIKNIRKFSNPRGSDKVRRNMIQHGGGGFMDMLNDISNSISKVLDSPLGRIITGVALLA